MLNLKLIARFFANILNLLAIILFLPLGIAFFYREGTMAAAFGMSIIVLLTLGISLSSRFHDAPGVIKMRDGIFIVAASWILIPFIGAIPFVISGQASLVDAFFECASGFTTTGSSVFSDVEALPKSLLFWRSCMNWIGGMGILIYAIALLPSLGINGIAITRAESTGPSLEKQGFRMTDHAKILCGIYLGMTVLCAIALCLGGMNLFDSIIHTFGSVSSGGFSNYNASVGAFDSQYLRIIICVFMVLSGVSYPLYVRALRGKPSELLQDPELQLYLLILGISTAAIGVILYNNQICATLPQDFGESAFQCISVMTTTGFCTTDYDAWPAACKIVLFFLMFFGGCSSSTSGGLKIIRVIVLLKLIRVGIKRRLHPNTVFSVKVGKKSFAPEMATSICSFFLLYCTLFILGALVVSLDGVDLITAFSASAACLGNIGPGFALVGPACNFSLLSDPVTLFLGLEMIAGRLELFTVIMIFTPQFWRSNM